MKCPNCDGELTLTKRGGVAMEMCAACKGMWLTPQELNQLEDKVFDFGDDEKGTLVFEPADDSRKCPECGQPMKSFQYRLWDLDMDFCERGHGYWLTADEDKRVLELMKREEHDLGRKILAEDRWAAHLRYLQSGSFMDRLREWAIDAMDPKTKPSR